MSGPLAPQYGGVLTIDLSAAAENWRRLAARMGGGACAAVVKADAYGCGAAKVGPALARAGCRVFFVALPCEGAALRAVVPDAEIYVFSGVMGGDLSPFRAHALRPVANTPEQAALCRDAEPPYAVHVDTGMNRLGLNLREYAALKDDLSPALLMTHLACADDPDHPLNARQAAAFRAIVSQAPGVAASFANSSGLFLSQEWRFDLGRPGLGLYGGNPTPGRANPMRPVVTAQARILHHRTVEADGTVGYGASRAVKRGARLVTVAAGYADGLPRALENRGFAHIDGRRVPLAGRVSMDLSTFEVSAVPRALCRPGGLVTLFGGEAGADMEAVAACAGTLSYELLTSLSRRFARVYIGA